MLDRGGSAPPWRHQALLITLIVVVNVLIVLAIIGPRSILPSEPPAAIGAGPSVRVTPSRTDSPPRPPNGSASVPPTEQPPPTDQPTPPDEPPPSEPAVQVLLRETFDDFVMGPLVAPGWSASPDVGSLTVAAIPTSVDRSARLSAPTEGRTATACRILQDLPDRYTVQADVRLSGDAAPGMLMAIEAAGRHAQVDRSRESVLFLDGAGSVAGDVRLEPDIWYRLSVQVDVDSASYAVAIQDLGRPARAFREDGLTLRDSPPEAPRLCFSVRSRTTAGLNIDDVTIATP